jgi:hypothetical protein
MNIEFEPTRSFCYKFGRYVVLQEVQQLSEVVNGEPFRLTELAQSVIDKYLSPEQQQTKVKKAQSDRLDPVHSIIKFVVSLISKEQEIFINLGGGMFRAKTSEDVPDEELDESALEDGDATAAEFEGWIYAFSFPALVKPTEPFPIKIGKTLGHVEDRVASQCKGSAIFDKPVILRSWQVKRVGPTELAIHNTLKAWGKWRENAPGVEWFDTTVSEIVSILNFLNQK